MKTLDYCMVMVSDMAKSVAFYRDVLGLELKMESPGWTEFNTGNTTLALHAGGEKPSQPLNEKLAGMCSIGFYTDNVDEMAKQLTAKGAMMVMPPTERPNEGIKLMVVVDPDGMGISYAQPLKRPAHA